MVLGNSCEKDVLGVMTHRVRTPSFSWFLPKHGRPASLFPSGVLKLDQSQCLSNLSEGNLGVLFLCVPWLGGKPK